MTFSRSKKTAFQIILSSYLFIGSLVCDVLSTKGVIHFDRDSNSNPEMTLNATGLGIGVLPSENLHVLGNALISQQLIIGTSSGSSNLHLNGSYGTSYQTVSSNASLTDHSMVLADSSSDNITLTLPYAGNVAGRMITIKKNSLLNSVYLYGAGNLIDDAHYKELSSSVNLCAITLISDGVQWNIFQAYSVPSDVAKINLVGWWKLDESSGTTALDSSGTSHHGTVMGSANFSGNGTAGVVDRALVFDGSDDFIEIPDSDNLSFGNGTSDRPFSMSVWINSSNAATAQGILSKASSFSVGEYYFLVTTQAAFLAETESERGIVGSQGFPLRAEEIASQGSIPFFPVVLR